MSSIYRQKKIDRTLRYTRSTDYAQYSDRALIEGCSETDRQRGRKKERERKRGEEKFTFKETKGVLVIHGGAKNDRGSSRQRKNEKKEKNRYDRSQLQAQASRIRKDWSSRGSCRQRDTNERLIGAACQVCHG